MFKKGKNVHLFRFFSSSVPKPGRSPSTGGFSDSKDLGSFKPVHSNTANMYNSPGSDVKTCHTVCDRLTVSDGDDDVTEVQSKTNSKNEDSDDCVKPSPVSSKHFRFSRTKTKDISPSSSAFNWSKFKFKKQTSSENVSSSPQVAQSLSQPFKTVRPNMNKDTGQSVDETTSKESEKRTFNVEVEDDGESSSVGIREVTLQSADNSYPYSIDSMCMTQSDMTQSSSQPDLPSLGHSDTFSLLDSDEVSVKRVPSLSLFFQTSSQESKADSVEDESDSGSTGQSRVTFGLGSQNDVSTTSHTPPVCNLWCVLCLI